MAFNNIMIAIKESDSMFTLVLGLPQMNMIKQKAAIIFKTDSRDEQLSDEDVQYRVCFMEMNKTVLENIQALAGEVYLPILKNPKNQSKWSELVSKDLMDKFNVFLAQVQVTNG